MADKPPINTLSFAALRACTFPPENYIISEGLLAKNGLMFITGPPKAYKSFVNQSMAFHLVTGTSLFDTYRMNGRMAESAFLIPKPQRVLLLEQEIGFFDVRERLLPLYQSASLQEREMLDANLFVHSRDHTMRLDTKDGANRIGDIIAKIAPDVVLFDPLIEFHASNENDSQAMGLVMHNLTSLQENLNFSASMTHHMGKPDASGYKVGPDLMRGSSVLFGKLDTVIVLTPKNRNAGVIKMEFTIRRGRPISPMMVKLDWTNLKVTFQEWETGRRKTAQELLSDNSPIQ